MPDSIGAFAALSVGGFFGGILIGYQVPGYCSGCPGLFWSPIRNLNTYLSVEAGRVGIS
jgi:hypothetical protein